MKAPVGPSAKSGSRNGYPRGRPTVLRTAWRMTWLDAMSTRAMRELRMSGTSVRASRRKRGMKIQKKNQRMQTRGSRLPRGFRWERWTARAMMVSSHISRERGNGWDPLGSESSCRETRGKMEEHVLIHSSPELLRKRDSRPGVAFAFWRRPGDSAEGVMDLGSQDTAEHKTKNIMVNASSTPPKHGPSGWSPREPWMSARQRLVLMWDYKFGRLRLAELGLVSSSFVDSTN
ncbi:hypothetical protein B0T18DRAFT_399064 [Schizothecium vesticola]|uniref:Uncharacterized protein n=1 Tax=Schizothecium vesticola TaxID=314040 RepID=A0AA40FB28_9PEZI|nr:hypothetical protein B0T18DRAFT_399064 [Schizothecium vesticola]